MHKVERDGAVAVLVSEGFGAGWSSWNDGDEWFLYSPEVVEWVESGKPGGIKALELIVAKQFPDNTPYCGGGDDLVVEWVPKGSAFKINEYDGNERLVYMGNVDWYMA